MYPFSHKGFPGDTESPWEMIMVKNPPAKAGDAGLIPERIRDAPEEEND